ncbi:hypothetical protein E2562_021906 [Oryza meyeriana var. granulata]|uniref:Uncharacterized protein n=1 Tax=Oryza meyeriana var. granulata TaxID=110450 RepID=A0A6G1C6T8_9ORYZ|nr:hypothetical protein E2562_021906 [Oryza meyeriana var. granulata]
MATKPAAEVVNRGQVPCAASCMASMVPVASDVLLYREAERASATDLAVVVNKEEGYLEGETKEDDADDKENEQLPDVKKAKECPEGSKEQ